MKKKSTFSIHFRPFHSEKKCGFEPLSSRERGGGYPDLSSSTTKEKHLFYVGTDKQRRLSIKKYLIRLFMFFIIFQNFLIYIFFREASELFKIIFDHVQPWTCSIPPCSIPPAHIKSFSFLSLFLF